MPIVNIIEENISIEVKENTILLDAIRSGGLNIETPCNGMGFCGKCKVIAIGSMSEPTDEEKKIINQNKQERLSCMAKVIGNLEVYLPLKKEQLKTINQGASIKVEIDSTVKITQLPKLNRKECTSYVDLLNYEAISVNIYNKLSKLENSNIEDVFGVVYQNNLLDIVKEEIEIYGLAIDIGTTGISYYLINLNNGKIIKQKSSLNPQTMYGGDVLSRITFCMENEDGTRKLQNLIVEEINKSIKELIDEIDNLYHICIAANTTMLHLLLGINPKSLAKAPYRAVFLETNDLKVSEIGIKANDEAILDLIPCASSYIGGDIISGLLASGFQNKNKAVFIDIGTNGEIAVIFDNKISATSTAAGPALEGMNIEYGCRAQSGAIENFYIDDEYNISYKTIGNKKAIGICGSGLIDIVAALVKRDIIMKSGRWNKKLDIRVANRLRDNKFYITDEIYISQKDIRQIQLAKGAIAAGVILLLNQRKITIQEVKTIYIAGAFGYHVNAESIKTIGLIPKGFNGNIEFLGNTALEGARLAITNTTFRSELRDLSKSIEIFELSLSYDFQEVFIKELNF